MFVPSARHYVWIFVVSLSILVLEIAVARILSVAMVSHYAFLAISLAMFGLGLSGLIVYLFPNFFNREALEEQLTTCAVAFGITGALAMLVFLNFQIVQELSWAGFVTLSFAYTVLMVPFFFGGLCVSLLMTHFSARIGKIYFADLIGASTGCLVVVGLMEMLPAPVITAVVSLFMTVAAAVLERPIAKSRPFLVGGAVAISSVLLVGGLTTNLFTMRYVKSYVDFYSDYEVWNSFSRISAFDVEQNAAQIIPLPNPANSYSDAEYPETMVLDIDGAAWTPMTNFNGDIESIQYLRDSVLYLVHHVKPDASVLIIGTGGGRDILAAKAFGQPRVRGLELNPLMRHVVQERYGDYSGKPYTLEGVEVTIDEARSRLHKVDDTFDIIQLSLIDTFSLNAAGGFVFTENNLYTREAFREYFNHLNNDGILSLTRYFVNAYPLEVLKLLTLAREAWAAEGISDISDRVVVMKQGLNASVLVKRSPFTPEELMTLREVAKATRLRVLYSPSGEAEHMEIEALITTPDLQAYVDAYPFLIEAPTDDRPFFFQFLRGRLATVPEEKQDPFRFLLNWDDALALMRLLIAVVASLAALFFFGPPLFPPRPCVGDVGVMVVAPALLYFACLGYGFMMIEVPLMQGLVLLLGYPVYALAVVLFSLLLFSGLGSLFSARFEQSDGHALRLILSLIVIVSLVYRLFLPAMIQSLLPSPAMTQIVVTIVSLAPIGLLLGMAYPLGIGLLRTVGEGLVPWAWGVNGAMSVVASVLAPFLGSRIGFSAAMLTGTLAYAMGLLCIVAIRGQRSTA